MMFILLPGEVYIVEAVITQGRSDSDNWVTEYAVEYSSDKRIWLHVKNDRQQMVRKFIRPLFHQGELETRTITMVKIDRTPCTFSKKQFIKMSISS